MRPTCLSFLSYDFVGFHMLLHATPLAVLLHAVSLLRATMLQSHR